MTGKDIMEALSFADDKYIQDAQDGTLRRKVPFAIFYPWLPACAWFSLGFI